MSRFRRLIKYVLPLLAVIIMAMPPEYTFADEIDEGGNTLEILDEPGEISEPVSEIEEPVISEEIEDPVETSEPEEPEEPKDPKENADEPKGEAESEDTDDSDVSTGVEVKLLAPSERVIYASKKVSLKKAFAMLPRTWTVIFDDGSEKEVGLSWECLDNYDKDKLSSYVFKGTVRDSEIAPYITKKMGSRIVMEIFFEDQLWDLSDHSKNRNPNQMPLWERVLSPHSIMPQIAEERKKEDEEDEAFLRDYGKDAESVIKVNKEIEAENCVLSSSTEKIFRAISPSPDNVYYASLSKEERAFYDRIDSYVTRYLYYGKEPLRFDSCTVTEYISYGTLSYNEAMDVFRIYYMNNPQAFFLTLGSLACSNRLAFAFLPDADTPEEIESRADTIARNLKSIAGKVREEEDDYSRIKRAQQLLSERIAYDWDAVYYEEDEGPHQWRDWREGDLRYCQSIMSVFSGKRRQSVCAGYAHSYMSILRLAGIEAIGITGSDHEWNKVYLYGKWYCVDTTFDDLSETAEPCGYSYFLKSDATLKKADGRVWDKFEKGKAPKSGSDYSTKLKRYKIRYKLSGGKNHRMNPDVYTAQSGTIKLYKPTRKGYRFFGWYRDKEYEKKVTSINASSGKKYTLYAKWKPIEYKIKYKLGGGENNSKNPSKYTVSKKVTLRKPKREGYTFAGWYTDKKFKHKITSIKKGSTGKVTLYAKWKKND